MKPEVQSKATLKPALDKAIRAAHSSSMISIKRGALSHQSRDFADAVSKALNSISSMDFGVRVIILKTLE